MPTGFGSSFHCCMLSVCVCFLGYVQFLVRPGIMFGCIFGALKALHYAICSYHHNGAYIPIKADSVGLLFRSMPIVPSAQHISYSFVSCRIHGGVGNTMFHKELLCVTLEYRVPARAYLSPSSHRESSRFEQAISAFDSH